MSVQTVEDQLGDLLMRVAMEKGGAPLNQWPGVWEFRVDEQWVIAWNGHPAQAEWAPEGGALMVVQPFGCAIEYNGWPAGEVHPILEGWIAKGEGANAETLIAALNSCLGEAQP